jgi:RNA repair pathway DNA polymerase beta family
MLIRPAPEVHPPGTIRYVVLYGSHAHGTATPTSDEDWRGVYQADNDHFLGLNAPQRTWEQKPDITMWELAHFCRLLLGGNPNISGLLSAPDDCIAEISPVISLLRDNRQVFVTRALASAYLGWMERELRDIKNRADVRRATPIPPDPKRLSHLPRLMFELEGAIETGEIPVRATGAQLDYIMAVKTGHPAFGYDEVAGRLLDRLPSLHERGRALPPAPRAFVAQILLRARHGEFG